MILFLFSLIISNPLTLLSKERQRKIRERIKKIKDCIRKEKSSESFKQMINNTKSNLTLGKIIKLNRNNISPEDMKIYNKCRRKIY